MFNAKTMALLLGVTFILVGIVGFVPNPLVSSQGFFVTNAVHNLVHVVTGIAFLVMRRFAGMEALLIVGAGLAYGAVAVLGFMTAGDHLLGIVHINQADRWLHAGLAVAIVAIGALSKSTAVANDHLPHSKLATSALKTIA